VNSAVISTHINNFSYSLHFKKLIFEDFSSIEGILKIILNYIKADSFTIAPFPKQTFPWQTISINIPYFLIIKQSYDLPNQNTMHLSSLNIYFTDV
jgi:hypothetical protein